MSENGHVNHVVKVDERLATLTEDLAMNAAYVICTRHSFKIPNAVLYTKHSFKFPHAGG